MANLILGMVKDYNYDQIQPFLDSLSRVSWSGKVVLFVSGISSKTAAKLRQQGVELIYFSQHYPFISGFDNLLQNLGLPEKYDLPLSLCTERFVMYYLYLSRFGREYNRIMLTDVRDVIFQKDPFAFADQGNLSVFLEDKRRTIAACPHNSSWIKRSFGDLVYDQIKARPISCNGIIISPWLPLLDYLKRKIDLIFRVGPPGIVGQGFHNYLVYTAKLPQLNIFSNESGPVLTLGLVNNYKQNAAGELLNESGEVANVVHQYDRHPELAKRYYSSAALRAGYLQNWKHWCLRPLKRFPKFYYSLKKIYHKVWQQ